MSHPIEVGDLFIDVFGGENVYQVIQSNSVLRQIGSVVAVGVQGPLSGQYFTIKMSTLNDPTLYRKILKTDAEAAQIVKRGDTFRGVGTGDVYEIKAGPIQCDKPFVLTSRTSDGDTGYTTVDSLLQSGLFERIVPFEPGYYRNPILMDGKPPLVLWATSDPGEGYERVDVAKEAWPEPAPFQKYVDSKGNRLKILSNPVIIGHERYVSVRVTDTDGKSRVEIHHASDYDERSSRAVNDTRLLAPVFEPGYYRRIGNEYSCASWIVRESYLSTDCFERVTVTKAVVA